MRARLGPVCATLAVLVLVAVVAAVNGPVRVSDPVIDFDEIFAGVEFAESDDSAAEEELPPLITDSTDRSTFGAALGTAITVAVFLAFIVGLWKVVQAILRNRTPRPDRHGPDVVAIETVRRAAQDEADQLATIASGQASNAVVACWVRLEQTAADAGARRHPSQTPTEFTVGLLTSHHASPTAVDTLLALYHRARFSSAPLPDGAVTQARSALEEISRTLASHDRESESAR